MSYLIRIEKEYLKFSSAHFTLFDEGREPLHGHNYSVKLELEADTVRNGFVVNFQSLKDGLRTICERLDEKVLLPTSGRVTINEKDGHVHLVVDSQSQYMFPKEEVVVLPVENVTCESLAFYISEELMCLRSKWDQELRVKRLRIWVEETPGQSGGYCVTL